MAAGTNLGRKARHPIILCLPDRVDPALVEPLVGHLRASGRPVIVALRPLASHLAGRRSSILERLPSRLQAAGVHWVGVGTSACETFQTISAARGVASITLLEPHLEDQEPSHPGRPGVPKLVVLFEKRRGKARKPPPPGRYVCNLVGPLQVRVLREGRAEDELARALLEFFERVEAASEGIASA